MLTQDNLTEWIDGYLNKTLSAEDIVTFEAYLAANPSLHKEIAAQQLVRAGLRKTSRMALKNTLKQIHTEMEATADNVVDFVPIHSPIAPQRRYFLVGAAAILFAMVCIGVYQFVEPTDDDGNLATTHNKTYAIEFIEQNAETQGFAGQGTPTKEYKTLVLLHTNTYDKPHYEFIHRDTITLLSNQLHPEKDKIQLQYDNANNAYKLVINGKSFEVEQGFKGVKELK